VKALLKTKSTRSLPEEVDRDRSPLWLLALLLVSMPVWLVARSIKQPNTLGFFFLYAGAVGVFLGIRHMYRRVIAWSESLSSFVVDHVKATADVLDFTKICWERKPGTITFCLAFTTIAIAAFRLGGLFVGLSQPELAVAYVFVGLTSYVCALGLLSVRQLTKLIRLLGNYEVLVTAHQFGVMSAGSLLVDGVIDAGVIWCLYTATATVCLSSGLVPSLVLAAPALTFFVLAFLTAQVPLHRRMLDFKRSEVRKIEMTLRSLDGNDPAGDESRRMQIEFLEKRRDAVLLLPEWPFSWSSLFAVVASSAASLAAPLLKFTTSEVIKLLHI